MEKVAATMQHNYSEWLPGEAEDTEDTEDTEEREQERVEGVRARGGCAPLKQKVDPLKINFNKASRSSRQVAVASRAQQLRALAS